MTRSSWVDKIGLGNPAYNGYARLAYGVGALLILGALALILLALLATSAQQRTDLVLGLFGLAMIGPIPFLLAVIFSQRAEHTHAILNGEHWAEWRYSPLDHPRTAEWLPRNVEQAFLTPHGVVWGGSHKLVDFRSGLTDVSFHEQTADAPARLEFAYFFRRRSKYGFVLWKDHKKLNLPVPRGRETEAAALVERYRAHIGRPSEMLNSEWRLAIRYGIAMPFLLVPILCALFPLSTAAIEEEFDARATQAAIYRQQDIDNARAAFARVQPNLERFYAAAADRAEQGWQSIDPVEMGFAADANLIEIISGRCPVDGEVYLFAFERDKTMFYGGGDPGAFLRTTADPINLSDCAPTGYDFIYYTQDMADGWLYAVLQRDLSGLIDLLTAAAPLVATPTPAR